ncbi:MAG TPA: class I SAM-dependent methyltransferase [Thermoplasmata archaeon]|nr:class I SAM-dependent methyltransferase [Thermoplasmata archaeon]
MGASPLEVPYTELAAVYDRVYSWKRYEHESRLVRALVRRYGPPRARTVLDVACGTGGHLRFLSGWFDCTGLDASRAMLTVARARVPSARFVQGRMPRFDLGRTFDVVTCLFSSIGYVRTPTALRATVRTLARHLAPQGLLIVEPWLTPSVWKPGSFHLQVVPSPTSPIARMNSSRTVRGRSVMEMHYLVPSGPRVRHWVEVHDLGLFSRRETEAAFRAAGLDVRRLPSRFYGPGHTDRGLYLGTWPA